MLPPKLLWRVKMLNNKKPMGKFAKKPVVIQNNTKYRPGDVVTLKVVRLRSEEHTSELQSRI